MDNSNSRYARHYALKGFGEPAQKKLCDASILVIGAGGLGCPALQYLAASGVGRIGIADGDQVALSNLQRQVLFDTKDIGRQKASTAAKRLLKLNPEINVEAFDYHITTENALELLKKFDIILDCTDNFATRYLINDACALLSKPLVFGAVSRFEGQVAIFNSGADAAQYRDLFPVPPDASEVEDCNQAGVLGVLPGTIGTLQATEAIKLICGLEGTLVNRLFSLNLINYGSLVLEIQPCDENRKSVPKTANEFNAMNYEWFCGMAQPDVAELSPAEFLEKTADFATIIIDVREPGELPQAWFRNQNIALSRLSEQIPEIEQDTVIVFCQSGKRSLKAAQLLRSLYGPTKKISHLRGGLMALTTFENGKKA